MSDDDTRIVPFVTTQPTTNKQFLELLFGDKWREAIVTSFTRDPADPKGPREDWNGWFAGDVLDNRGFDQGNTYFCPSLLVPGAKDRKLSNFRELNVLTVDDINTKIRLVEVVDLLRRNPTYLIETSLGNYQAGWKLEPGPETKDLAWVKGMLNQLDQALKGQADNLTNPIAWRRLPVGFNTKKALVSSVQPKGWKVRLRRRGFPGPMIRGLDWMDEIEPRIGVITKMTTIDRGIGNGQRPDAVVLGQDPVYQALEAGGHILGEKITSDKHWAVTIKCPWISGHGPTRPLTGAEYVPATPGNRGWFHCFHCETRGQAEFKEQLDEVLRSEGQKIVAAFEFDDVDPAMLKFTAAQAVQALAGYEETEDGFALAFADKHEGQLRFDHTRGAWFRWTGGYWRQDEAQYAFRWARALARAFRAVMQDATPGKIRLIGKINVAKAIEVAARADAKLAVDGLSWDQDPWLVGAPGCEIDLRTGMVLPPGPTHGITKQLLVAPEKIPTPVWDQFLFESTGGDVELIEFLQAWSGYGLTGDTSEEKFVFIYGPGGNGKGTFLHTISAILNDYAARADVGVFMVRKNEPHKQEIARLAGVRSLTTSEIAQGQTFNINRLKDFTGRDGKIEANFMKQNSFEFMPQFKITIVGNTQPRLPNVDDAMRRRMILVPFTQTPVKVDTTLKDQLRAEYPGILRWMIDGELRRARQGLAALVPSAVATATEEYLEEQNMLKLWAGERCVFGPSEKMAVARAFEDYKSWCYSRGEHVAITLQEFSKQFVEQFSSCRKKRAASSQTLFGASLSQQDV